MRQPSTLRSVALAACVTLGPTQGMHSDPWLEIGLAGSFLDEIQTCLHAEDEELKRWSLALEGNGERVLMHWEADRYWTGSLTIPMQEARERERDHPDADAIDLTWVHWFSRN